MESFDPWNHKPTIRYLNRLREKFGPITLLGFPHLGDIPSVRIDYLFVPPLFAESLPERDTGEEERRARGRSMAQLLTDTPHVAILGDPGSGKSTLVAWLCHSFASRQTNELNAGVGRLVPVPMVLRDMKLDKGIASFADLIARVPRDVMAEEEHTLLLPAILDGGAALFLIDGLDEVADLETRRAVHAAVLEGAERHPACRLVMTSRILGYTDTARLDGEARSLSKSPEGAVGELMATRTLPVAYLQPFHRGQVEQFVRNWYGLRESNPDEALRRTSDLLAAIDGSVALLDLARRPSLLLLMALIHRVYAQLPAGRALLFAKISEAYLESLDSSRKLAFSRFSLAEQERWLACIAFAMQQDRIAGEGRDGLTIDAGRVQEILRGVMDDPDAVQAFLQVVCERSGLFVPRATGVYAFAHLSFQEYYAALHLRDRLANAWADPAGAEEAVGTLAEWSVRPAGVETVLLLAEIVSPVRGMADQLVERLLKANRERKERKEAIALGGVLTRLETEGAVRLSPNVREAVGAARDELMREAVVSSTVVPKWARSLEPLRGVPISRLGLSGDAADLNPLVDIPGLSSLTLFANPAVVERLPRLPGVTRINMIGTPDPRTFELLADRVEVIEVMLLGPQSLQGIDHLARLEMLILGLCPDLDLAPLTRCRHKHGRVLVYDDSPLQAPPDLTWTIERLHPRQP